ncbi:hypothetical protein KAR91_83350 [Candidatus Pacearchaeota archaeon]|nr:hypothetical protein [Candidatus Pacearchaeota archaeon]
MSHKTRDDELMKKRLGRKPNNEEHKVKALSEYLLNRCHEKFAGSIQISKTHLSLILSGKRKAPLPLANRIILETKFEVTLKDLNPELYGEIMKYGKMSREVL